MDSNFDGQEIALLRKDAGRYLALRNQYDLIVVLRDVTKDGISADWPTAPGWTAIETADELDQRTDAIIPNRASQHP